MHVYLYLNISVVRQEEPHLLPLLPNKKTVHKSPARIRVQRLFQLLQDDHVIHNGILSICDQLLPVFDPSEESGEHVVKLFGTQQNKRGQKIDG